jgi:hypothetical protein
MGFNHRGIALEIMALEETERSRLVVFHARRPWRCGLPL